MTISLCMIVRDEAHVLARCLDSVRGLVDEIVIVDTGSRDDTCRVARHYTDRVVGFPWTDDFSAARNFSFAQAAGDYIFWLDADELLLEPDRILFAEMRKTPEPCADVIMLPYRVAFDAAGEPGDTRKSARLVRRSLNLRWEGVVRERLALRGTIADGKPVITHRRVRPRDPNRDLRILERQLARGHKLTPRERYAYARELYDHERCSEAVDCLRILLEQEGSDPDDRVNAGMLLADCYDRLGLPNLAIRALLQSMAIDPPCAETCCALGARFAAKDACEQAAFWYEAALHCRCAAGSSCSPDCRGFLPYIRLCMCYRRLGDDVRAEQNLRRAQLLRPEDDTVRHYAAYFEQRRTRPEEQQS